jgi:lincosamide nucleotidyltransferase A/C/D/E
VRDQPGAFGPARSGPSPHDARNDIPRCYGVLSPDGGTRHRNLDRRGWGVDALLGKQTRAHADLDIVVQEKDLTSVTAFLESRGFLELPREDSRPWNFAMRNGKGKEIDLHVISLDEKGNGLYGPPERGEGRYPADALEGEGTVEGVPVRCISPEFQIHSHTGYEFNDADVQDVTALAHAFGLQIPQEYLCGSTRANDR